MTQTLYIHSPIKVPLFSGFLLRLFGNVDIVVGFSFFFFKFFHLLVFIFQEVVEEGGSEGKRPESTVS